MRSRGTGRDTAFRAAWTTDGRAGIAAPRYADSLVISGPAALAEALLASGLEVFPVDRHRQVSVWTD